MMNFLEKYRFKRDMFHLFEQHQYELVSDNGLEVKLQPGADQTVYHLGYTYCGLHNLHLSIIQQIKSHFEQWFEKIALDRDMRIW